jgi:hypothetical protein
MIPSNPDEIKKLEELAARNNANGNWGTETTVPGIPGRMTPQTPEEHAAKGAVSGILSKSGDKRAPKRK